METMNMYQRTSSQMQAIEDAATNDVMQRPEHQQYWEVVERNGRLVVECRQNIAQLLCPEEPLH